MFTRDPWHRSFLLARVGACLGLVGLACSPDPATPGITGEPVTSSSSSGSTGTTAPQEPTTSPTTALPDPSGEPGAGSTGTSSGDSTDAGSTGVAAMCGDGEVGPEEECDLGGDNNDEGACTVDCKNAVCGDGKVHADMEACDLGRDNGDAYGGCGGCQWNALCGDGVLDPVEQCDAGVKNGSGESPENSAPCTVGCRWDARVVFMSSELYDGDFGGLDGADLRCRNLAKAAGISAWPGFRAWLSNADQGPLERFTLVPAKPYVLPTGERIADSLGDLVLNGPRDGIRVDELGKPVLPSLVWTNTGVAGEPHSGLDHCQHWDSAAPELKARVGRSHEAKLPVDVWQTWSDERRWSSYTLQKCHLVARLYCFEN